MLKILVPVTATEMRGLKKSVLHIHRSTPHISRKFYHFIMGLMCFTLYAFVLNRQEALVLLGTIGGVWMAADVLRLRSSRVNAITLKYFGKIMRREELKSITGNSFYILGLLTLVIFFSKPVALLSVLFLAMGDPVAAIVGTRWGRHRLMGKKSVEGALANWFVSGIASFAFGLFFLRLDSSQSLVLGVLGATISTVVELIPFPIDDNFTIPVGSALLLTFSASVFPFLAFL